MGRSAPTSFIILDAQSVKNTETAENKGYDGSKKISDIKRHFAVDINGWPQAIHITTANVSERDGAVALLALNSEQFRLVKRVMADGGYTGENFAGLVQSTIGAEMIIAKQSDLKHGRITHSGGWLNDPLVGWINVGAYGATANVTYKLFELW